MVDRQIDESIRYEFIYFPALRNLTITSILYCVFGVFCYCFLSILFGIDFEYGWYLIVLELMLADIGAFPRITFDNELIMIRDRFQARHQNATHHRKSRVGS